VLRADGSPAAGATITALWLGASEQIDGEAGDDGCFSLEDFRFAGEYFLLAWNGMPGDGIATRRLSLAHGSSEYVVLALAPDARTSQGVVELSLVASHADGGEVIAGELEVQAQVWSGGYDEPVVSATLPSDARRFLCPRGIVQLSVEDPLEIFVTTTVTLDTERLPDGAIVEVRLEPEP
jgi:hypothetical protein